MRKVWILTVIVVFLIPFALFAEGTKGEVDAVDEGDELVLYTSLETAEAQDYISAAESATGL